MSAIANSRIKDLNGFVSWHMLRSRELSRFYIKVVRKWKALLSAEVLTERAYLKHLREYAGFFFHDGLQDLISISEFEFGADLRCDFVVCRDRSSYGFEYEFIEIESPNDRVFTRKGAPSPMLTEAMNQIQRWRLWLDANRPEAKRILPSSSFIVADQPTFKFTIIIGRRQEKDEWLHLRNQLAGQMNIEIRSFDYLSDRLSKQLFPDSPVICSAEFDRLPFEVKNALANPFFSALRSSAWRTMVKSPTFHSVHMIALNASALLEEMSPNSGYSDFLNAWTSLPYSIRETKYAEAKQLA